MNAAATRRASSFYFHGGCMTLLNDPRPISADSHALEGPEVFEGLPERFGDDAPRVVHKDGEGDYISIPNQPKRSRNVAVMALAGTRLDYKTPLPTGTRLQARRGVDPGPGDSGLFQGRLRRHACGAHRRGAPTR